MNLSRRVAQHHLSSDHFDRKRRLSEVRDGGREKNLVTANG